VHADGRTLWNLSSISLIQDSQGNPSHLVCLHQDITDRKALEEHLEHQAFHDSLTELPNRALFLDRLEHALDRTRREGGPVAVLLLDLNNFKVINDSLGHDAGNTVLVEVAGRLRDSVRSGDTVSRLFGDEFAVLLEAPSHAKEAKRVAKRIQEQVEEPFDVEGQEVFVTLSIGIAFSETAEDEPKEILRHADLAMYEVKRGRKAQPALYNPSMNIHAMERLDLENVLRRAVDREELEVYYQPIIDLNSGDISGVEALARLRHPERGLVAASEFVQLAEETGLIRPIGQWVTKEACRQAKEWRKRYPEKALLMSVNLSASQFSHQSDLIPKILSDTGLNPQGLQLEITERTVMGDAEFSEGKLHSLKGLGVSLAIDDYGMGYSYLYYLKRMPVDYLKIDRSFITGLGEDSDDEAIVSGTIGIAHALGLKVIAEGVETADQFAKLKELGCDLAQGFHLAEPLSGEAMSTLLAGDRRW
jgi:diguanylate cyclase (GGDEF)-like protein